MYFSTTLIPLSAMTLYTAAATIPRQNDPHITDFRTYGAPGCFAENQGVYTITTSGLNVCQMFADPTVGSVFVVDITDGCSVYAYTDSTCSENQITVPVGIADCYNSTTSGLTSYEVVCSS